MLAFHAPSRQNWNVFSLATLAILPVLFASIPAFADVSTESLVLPGLAPKPIQDPSQQLIEEQRERTRQRQPAPSVAVGLDEPGTMLDIPPDTPVDQIVETGPVFAFSSVVLVEQGGGPYSPLPGVSRAKLDGIVAPFVGHALGTHRVSVLLKRLTDAFVAEGYVTTRALIGPQNAASGTLTVTIQVGHIGGFVINGKPINRLKKNETAEGGGWLTDSGYENSFPATAGDALRLQDIDQGVSQINRLRRNQAEVQILPGQSPGDSTVAIDNRYGDPLYYSLGSDNYGSSTTGVTRYRAGVEADNLIGLQESLSLNFIGTLDSNALVGSLAIPYGRHTFSYTLSNSEYQQVIGATELLWSRTLNHILGWNYMLAATQTGTMNLDATLSWRRTDRELNGSIGLNPQHIAVLRVGGNWFRKFNLNGTTGNVMVDGGLSQGLPWLEADHDAHGIARADAHSQFTKIDMTATFTLPLPAVAHVQLAYRGVLSGQYANAALFSSEQMYLGGADTIRGFRSGEIAGDRGIWLRNELAWINVPSWQDGRAEPYVFLDGGKANLIAAPGFPSLVGAGAGLRAQWQWRKQMVSGELLAGRALTQPATLGPKATLILGTFNWTY